ncbi:hypothetical protein CKO35_04760 [Ectothiorhodospira shaposhnikovii]|uniref:general secretion pathway protein GspK n=1 Tax=Ectothiorhodospira shaposhnikovii TaxID=1054 RepID=UPI001903670F|nr:type II secretion system protein GspK [Ectothiorhodospira shaposhnikovii]MBK1672619.1 hypothetical protein [Ectothiorhodospira shaposhnikovii]
MTSPLRQRGLALITVLWVVVILTLVVTSFTVTMRREAQMAVHLLHQAELRHVAEGATRLALQDLTLPAAQRRYTADGQWYAVPFGDYRVHLAVLDERGRVDLNAVALPALVGLLMQVGVDESRAVALGDAIADWRDPGGGRRLHAPPPEAYPDSGLGPRGNRPFHAVDELQRVLGMDPDLYRRLHPWVTVHSRGPWPDPAFAPAPVVAALPGMDRRNAEAWVQERTFHRAQGGEPPPFPGRTVGSTGRQGVYTLRAVARLEGGAAWYEQTVQLTGDPRNPYEVLESRHAPPGAAHWQAP